MDYAALEYWICAALLVLSMAGMGCTLSPRQFLDIAKTPRPLFLVWAAQSIVAPAYALLLGKLLFLDQGIVLGLLVVASLPGGAFSNLLTHVGRGNVPLSISATACSTLASLGTTVMVLRFFAGSHLPENFQVPVGRIVQEVSLFLLTPLVAGMLVGRLGPRRSIPMSIWLVRASLVLLAVFVVLSLASGRIRPLSHGVLPLLALFLFFSGSLWIGYGAAIWQRYSMDDGFAMAIEVAVRNTGLGLLLNASLFPAASGAGQSPASSHGEAVLYVLLVYSAVSMGMAWVEVYIKRNHIGVNYSHLKPRNPELPAE